jgi:hypothetical protein
MDSFGARDGGVKAGVLDDSGNDIVFFFGILGWGFLCGLGLVFCGPGILFCTDVVTRSSEHRKSACASYGELLWEGASSEGAEKAFSGEGSTLRYRRGDF